MANEKISAMPSITNSGTLIVPVIDPNNPGTNSSTTLPGPGGVTVGAQSLFGNPGTASALGVDITIGTNLTLTSGGTLNASGGGGGSYYGGLGISIDSGTINNTGTIVQPASTGTIDGLGITLTSGAPGANGTHVGDIEIRGPDVSNAGTSGPLIGSSITLYTGDTTITNAAGYVYGGGAVFAAGKVTNGVAVATGGLLNGTGAAVAGSAYAVGGGMNFAAGYAIGATSSTGGALNFTAGPGDQQGGGISMSPGTGAANGLFLVNNIGTDDPHVLNAKFQVSVAGVGYVGVYSKG